MHFTNQTQRHEESRQRIAYYTNTKYDFVWPHGRLFSVKLKETFKKQSNFSNITKFTQIFIFHLLVKIDKTVSQIWTLEKALRF